MTATKGYMVALAVFVADQLSKWWIIAGLELQLKGSIPLLPVLSFTWVENRGVSMGLLQADGALERWLLTGVTAAIALGVGWWMRRESNRADLFALSLVLGGALGNIVRQLHVHVVAREEGDEAWPGPVWGAGVALSYADGEAEACADVLRAELGI